MPFKRAGLCGSLEIQCEAIKTARSLAYDSRQAAAVLFAELTVNEREICAVSGRWALHAITGPAIRTKQNCLANACKS